MDATAIVLILLGAVIASHLSGFAAGRAHERNMRARRRRRLTTYDVQSPSGLFFHGPHKPSADAFAARYGGEVEPSVVHPE